MFPTPTKYVRDTNLRPYSTQTTCPFSVILDVLVKAHYRVLIFVNPIYVLSYSGLPLEC